METGLQTGPQESQGQRGGTKGTEEEVSGLVAAMVVVVGGCFPDCRYLDPLASHQGYLPPDLGFSQQSLPPPQGNTGLSSHLDECSGYLLLQPWEVGRSGHAP